jgi:peptide/nickel transport system substrate-binding protein
MSELKKLERLLSQGWISRRQFMKRLSAMGLAASVPGAMFGAAPAYAAAKKGGKFRVGLGHGSTTDSLDPAQWENAFTQFSFGYGSNNHLTETRRNGRTPSPSSVSDTVPTTI